MVEIDCKGKLNKNTPDIQASICQVKDHLETQKINDLTGNIYIPVLDDPITRVK